MGSCYAMACKGGSWRRRLVRAISRTTCRARDSNRDLNFWKTDHSALMTKHVHVWLYASIDISHAAPSGIAV